MKDHKQIFFLLVCHLATAAASDCTDFVVSPQPIVFTAHPSSQRGATAQGGDVQLSCAAFAQRCGGFQIPITSDYSNKQSWRTYRICWLYQPLNGTHVTENCNSSGNWDISESAFKDSNLTSNLIIRNASASSSSGSYSCFVEDWRMRYSSYPANVTVDLVQSGTIPTKTSRIMTYSNSTVYFNASDPTSKVPLKCREAPDSTKDHIWYEWYVNGSLTNNNNSTIEADSIQSFVCYTHFGNSSSESLLAAVYRVLPYGCLNPVVDLEYPTVNVKVHNNSHFTAEVKFCWSHPDYLGGLSLSEIGYHVQFEGLSSGSFPQANVLTENSKLCFEEQFTSMEEMTTTVNIKVTAVPKKNSLADPSCSLATQFPKTTLIGWRKLEIKDYCDRDEMKLVITDPLRQLSSLPTVRWYSGYYLCSADTAITEEVLRRSGVLYEYLFTSFGLFGRLDYKYIPSLNSSQRTTISLPMSGRKSCALMVYTVYKNSKFFDSHWGISDYTICTFGDPPSVQLSSTGGEVYKGEEVQVNFELSITNNRTPRTNYSLTLGYTSRVNFTKVFWISKNVKNGTIPFQLPTDLTDEEPELNITISISEDFDNIVEMSSESSNIFTVKVIYPPRLEISVSESIVHPGETVAVQYKIIGKQGRLPRKDFALNSVRQLQEHPQVWFNQTTMIPKGTTGGTFELTVPAWQKEGDIFHFVVSVPSDYKDIVQLENSAAFNLTVRERPEPLSVTIAKIVLPTALSIVVVAVVVVLSFYLGRAVRENKRIKASLSLKSTAHTWQPNYSNECDDNTIYEFDTNPPKPLDTTAVNCDHPAFRIGGTDLPFESDSDHKTGDSQPIIVDALSSNSDEAGSDKTEHLYPGYISDCLTVSTDTQKGYVQVPMSFQMNSSDKSCEVAPFDPPLSNGAPVDCVTNGVDYRAFDFSCDLESDPRRMATAIQVGSILCEEQSQQSSPSFGSQVHVRLDSEETGIVAEETACGTFSGYFPESPMLKNVPRHQDYIDLPVSSSSPLLQFNNHVPANAVSVQH